METIVKNQLLVLACITILAIIVIKLYYHWYFSRRHAKERLRLEKKIKEHDRRWVNVTENMLKQWKEQDTNA